MPDPVLAAMQRPAVDIYSGPLVAITDSLLADLAKIFRTKAPLRYLHRQWPWCMEVSLTNVFSTGDIGDGVRKQSLVLT